MQWQKILPLFADYLNHGCYPFYKEEGDSFHKRLHGVVLHVLENDLPQVEDISYITEVLLPKQGDFMIDRKYLFEVGGKGKNFDQIKDEPHSFLTVDDIETGHFNRIPLWMFGLLY